MPLVGVGASPPRGGGTPASPALLSRLCRPRWEEKNEAPELQKNWSSGWRTKVSERAPQLGGGAGAGPASDAPGLLPVLVTAPGASPPSAMQARPTPGAPQKLVPSQPQSHQQYASPRPRSPPHPPPHLLPSDGGRSQTRRQPGARRGLGAACPPPLPAGAVRPGGSKSAEQGAADAPTEQPRTHGPPAPAPRVGNPPDTLRRRAGSVISVLPDPRGTRKYVGEKFPLPHGGEDVGGERAEDGEQRWEDVSGPRCAHHPSPGRAG